MVTILASCENIFQLDKKARVYRKYPFSANVFLKEIVLKIK
jgi:hypothetical protein